MLNIFNKKTKNTFTLFPSANTTPNTEVIRQVTATSKSDYINKNIISGLTLHGLLRGRAGQGLKKDNDITLNEKIGETRHFPPAVKEWINSIYSFNKNLIKTLPITDNIVNRLIKSYFSLSPLINNKKSKRVQIRFRRLSLNRILVSKAEMKHTNNKVIITVYLYNRNKKFLIYKLKNLYKTFILKISGANTSTKVTMIKDKKAVVGKPLKIGSFDTEQKKRQLTSGLKNNKTYKALATSKKTSHINFKSNGWVSPKSIDNGGKNLVLVGHKKKFTTKRKPNASTKVIGLNKTVSKSTLYKPKVYNYVNFSNLTKKRLSKFVSKIKNINVKNKYKTLIINYYSVLSKYKLYGIGELVPNKNFYLNSVNLPNAYYQHKGVGDATGVNSALSNNIYAGTFYELLNINNQDRKVGFVFRTKRKTLAHTSPSRQVIGDFVSPYHLNKKGNRNIKNLMHKLRSFYKLFSLDNVYSYKPNTGIIANSTHYSDNAITKILKRNLVTNLLSLSLKSSGLDAGKSAIKKINLITLKAVRIIKRTRKNKNFLIKTLNWSDKTFTNYESKYYKRFIRKAYKKEMLYLYYIRMLSINNSKFKNWFLLGLKKVLSKIYNKNVEFNLVSLKYLHLNSDIFTESIAIKLKNRQNRLLTVLKKALALVKLPSAKGKAPLYNGLALSVATGVQRNKFKGLNLNTFSTMLLKNKDALHKLLLNIFTDNTGHSSHSNNLYKTPNYLGTSATHDQGLKKEVLNTINYKAVFGVRLEAAGRLSKRLTASRSVFKLKYKGSLKNIDSSYKGLSSVILKGNTKSNIQYTKISSKTRNGSFGLKGWVSGY